MSEIVVASKENLEPKKRLGFDRVTEKESRKKKKIKSKKTRSKRTYVKTEGLLAKAGKLKSPFVTFSRGPKIRFETQAKEEEVVLLLRSHWMTNVPWIIVSVFGFLAPLVWPFLPFAEILPLRFQTTMILFWYLLMVGFIFEKFICWYFNVFIVTNRRVVDVDFYSLLYKEVSDAELEQIEDVTYKMGGVLRAFLNYGDIYIQTAAERAEFEFYAVPKPDEVVKTIQDLSKSL